MKRSNFFSRLTGTTDEEYFEDTDHQAVFVGEGEEHRFGGRDAGPAHEDTQGQLGVDIYQTADAIVVKAFIAGVQPNSIDISLTREMLVISGTRTDEKEVEEEDYFQRELYWGSFSRTILLPEEVDVDMADASEKHGVLIIRLPKINKKRQTKLKIKSK